MYSKKISLRRYQHGFALIDVMISALVLAVGVIAFVKLENLSIKRAQQTDYRFQATGASNALLEALRADPSLINWLLTSTAGNQGNISINSRDDIAALAFNCGEGITNGSTTVSIADPNTWCTASGDTFHTDALNTIRTVFSDSFKYTAGKAVLCLRARNITLRPTQVRVIVVWKNAIRDSNGAATFAAANATNDCPANYAAAIPNADNINTTTPDRGYFEIYTRI